MDEEANTIMYAHEDNDRYGDNEEGHTGSHFVDKRPGDSRAMGRTPQMDGAATMTVTSNGRRVSIDAAPPANTSNNPDKSLFTTSNATHQLSRQAHVGHHVADSHTSMAPPNFVRPTMAPPKRYGMPPSVSPWFTNESAADATQVNQAIHYLARQGEPSQEGHNSPSHEGLNGRLF
eukprot:4775696-Prymnesium_polylepis.2